MAGHFNIEHFDRAVMRPTADGSSNWAGRSCFCAADSFACELSAWPELVIE